MLINSRVEWLVSRYTDPGTTIPLQLLAVISGHNKYAITRPGLDYFLGETNSSSLYPPMRQVRGGGMKKNKHFNSVESSTLKIK